MKDREYSMDKGKSKHQEEDEDSGKKSPFYSRDICGGSMMENQGLGNEKQGIKPALQDSKRPKDLDLGYETLVETTVSDPPPHENSREYSIDKGKGKQQKDSAEDNFFAWDYRGVASTMMEKMQYRKGEGLGKQKQGIKHPLQPTNRPQSLKLGLGYQNYDLVNTTVSDPPPNENSWDYIQRLKDDEENMVRLFKEAAAKVTLPRPATKFTLSRVPSENRRNPLPFQVIIKPKRKTISTEDSPEPALPPPPPPVEVLSSEASSSVEVDKVNIGEITLWKGRVSTKEVFGLPNSDLVPGVYEGGLKLWEGSIDLVKALEKESQTGNLSFSGKRVLELGCGHALPGIYACLKGSDAVHFQDFNAEVLRCLTIPNLNANLSEKSSSVSVGETEVRFFAGEWSEVHQLLPLVNDGETDKKGGYDIILMAETIYSISAQKSLYELIKRCLANPDGAVYMAAKKYYFGVGGGTRQFLSMIEKDGVLASTLVSEVTDGSSNVREVWKLSYK